MNEKGDLLACTSILCIAMMVFVTGNISGCEQPINGGGDSGGDSGGDGSDGNDSGTSDEPIQLAKENVRIGEFIVISHSSIKEGEVRTVSLEQPDGVVQEIEVVPHADGELSVAGPPSYRETTDALVGGFFDVSIDGVTSPVEIEVENMYQLPNLDEGSVFRLFAESAVEDCSRILAKLAGDLDGVVEPSVQEQFRSDVFENREFLQGLIDEWDADGRMTFFVSETETVEVNSENIRTLERYLASIIFGVHLEIARRNPSDAARLIGGNCIEQVEELKGDALVECLEQCIADVKESALRAAKVGGVIPTAVGAAITIAGIFVKSPGLIGLGAVVAAVGIMQGFLTSFAANQNTDTYGQDDGEGFSASREAISQAGRYTIGILSPGASLVISANDYSNSLEAAKCDGPNPRQRVIISDDLIEFCEFVFDEDSIDIDPTPDEPECAIKSDCAENEICVDNECVPDPDFEESCEQAGCPDGQACINGDCGPCELDTDCPDGQICIVDECVDGTDVGEGCEISGCDDGEVCFNSECKPFGVPSAGVCPGSFEMDFGVFSPSIHDVSMVEFVLNTDAYSATCSYSRTDGTPGTYSLVLFYEPVGLNPPSAGLCGEEDDDGDNIIAQNGYHSTIRTLTVISVIAGSVRIIDPDGVFGEMINNADSADVGSDCCIP